MQYLAGASTHECELPNPDDQIVSPEIPIPEAYERNQEEIAERLQDKDYTPNPYCDLVPDGFQGICHDRKDYDEDTCLYPCNDGKYAAYLHYRGCLIMSR